MNNLTKFYKDNHKRQVKIISSVMRFNKNLAEDIVQEAYLRAVKYEAAYDVNKASYKTWFNRIMFNVLREMQDKHKITDELNENSAIVVDLSYEDSLYILKEIRRLKNKSHQEVLMLFYKLGYTTKEISQITSFTQTNITTILKRFRERLIEKDGDSI